MTIEDLKMAAGNVAREMRESSAPSNRDLAAELRARFVAIRAELFQRGIFDPVLVRFDSATVPQASPKEIADALTVVASNL
ncbi:MAG: hypothetical protein M3041_02540 [Acidobacteriota bacterium]|nr:hypothetical protein [Acidobacteriota bacterium]